MDTRISTNQVTKTSNFLDLPPELRISIYEYYFANHSSHVWLDSPDSTKAYSDYPRLAVEGDKRHNLNAILRTCKKVYREAVQTMDEIVAIKVSVSCSTMSNWSTTVDIKRLSNAHHMTFVVHLNHYQGGDLVPWIERWLAITNGVSAARDLSIMVSHYNNAQEDFDLIVRTLEKELRCERARGNVMGVSIDNGRP